MKQYIFFLLCVFSTKALFCKEIFSLFPEYPEKNRLYRSITERYIDYHGKNNIESSLRNSGVSLVNKNLFDRIAHHEEIGCIGYHGSTQTFRIYQDVIRFILEEIVGVVISDTFHFFRIPLDPYYSYENASVSEYRIDPAKTLPPQFFLLLHDAYVLNIKSPFSVIRYAKIQPSKLKNYEESLRLLVGSASYNKDRAEEYCKQYIPIPPEVAIKTNVYSQPLLVIF